MKRFIKKVMSAQKLIGDVRQTVTVEAESFYRKSWPKGTARSGAKKAGKAQNLQ